MHHKASATLPFGGGKMGADFLCYLHFLHKIGKVKMAHLCLFYPYLCKIIKL